MVTAIDVGLWNNSYIDLVLVRLKSGWIVTATILIVFCLLYVVIGLSAKDRFTWVIYYFVIGGLVRVVMNSDIRWWLQRRALDKFLRLS